jgi:hypothetical protein
MPGERDLWKERVARFERYLCGSEDTLIGGEIRRQTGHSGIGGAGGVLGT